MAKKSYKIGDTIKVAQIEKIENTFILLEFDGGNTEGKILYIKETLTEEAEKEAIADIHEITYRGGIRNYGIYYYPKNSDNLKKMIDAISIPFGEMTLNVQSPFGLIERKMA